jgi:hypothetical protein
VHPSVLKLSRLFACTAALGALLILTIGYAALPAELPLTRGSVAAKSVLLVLRVPLINLLSLLLIVILERALARAHAGGPYRDNAMMALTALFATLGVKAFLETFELLALPTVYPWLPWLLLAAVAGGLALAALTGLPFLRKATARTMPRARFTAGEKLGTMVAVVAILGLQFLPLYFPQAWGGA